LMLSPDGLEPAKKEAVRRDLLFYCHRDTWGLVKLLDFLRLIIPIPDGFN
jgi:hypothetical protein